MRYCLFKKTKVTPSYFFKLIIFASFIVTQSFLTELFLYQNDISNGYIKIAQADTSDAWYNASWLCRKKITINHNRVQGSNQTNFPVLISFTDSSLRLSPAGKVQNASGYDIIFTDQNGTKLDHEIESYDGTNGTVVMWVRIPTLSYTVDTAIYIYYDNNSIATSQENKTGVWNGNYSAVYHLKESAVGAAGDFKDSTSHNVSSANTTNEPTQTAGKIGYGQAFNGVAQQIDMGNYLDIGPTDFTLSAWIKPPNVSTFMPIIAKRTAGGSYIQYQFSIGSIDAVGNPAESKGVILYTYNGSFTQDYYTSDFIDGNWHYVVATRVGGQIHIYVDGVDQSLTAVNDNVISTDLSNFSDFRIGNSNSPFFYNSPMDEVRISTAYARNSDWIKTEYYNQSTAPGVGNFIQPIGGEEDFAPILTQVTPVPTYTNSATPSYTFNSTKAGTISYSGDCSSSTTSAIAGDNTIIFNALSGGTHSNCTITVTDSYGNHPSLNVNSFTVDRTSPTVSAGSDQTKNSVFTQTATAADAGSGINASSYQWAKVSGPGTITFGSGNALSTTVSASQDGTYVISFTAADNVSNSASSSFTLVWDTAAPQISGVTDGSTYSDERTITFNKGTATVDGAVFASGNKVSTPGSHTLIVTYLGETSTIHFTISPASSILPAVGKPDISNIKIVRTVDSINISDIPSNVVQFAVSKAEDFELSSWMDIKNIEAVLKNYLDAGKLYLKFRTSNGSVSDTIIYTPQNNNSSNSDNGNMILKDGDIVKTANNPDVYIIKYNHDKQYKRLILSPKVFNSYRHLKWNNIKIVSQTQLDGFTTSNLVQVKDDKYIYILMPLGDVGQRRILDASAQYDSDSVYEINSTDRNSYKSVK